MKRLLTAAAVLLTAAASAVALGGVHSGTRAVADCPGAAPWQEAHSKIGQTVTVRGPVVGTTYASASSGQPTFLDIGLRYPDPARFTAVIWGAQRNAFGGYPEDLFRGKTLCMTGRVELYRGSPQIELSSSDQLMIVTFEAPASAPSPSPTPPTAPKAAVSAVDAVGGVVDGDTIALKSGGRVRLVQIDTPEFWGKTECFGPQASGLTKRLLPKGTPIRLDPDPTTDDVDEYGRMLRYVIRLSDGMNVNLQLVATGAAAPYYFAGQRGVFATRLDSLVRQARAKKRGLWGACPRTPYNPSSGVQTRR